MRATSLSGIRPGLERLKSLLTEHDLARTTETHLMLASFDSVPLPENLESVIQSTERELDAFCERFRGSAFRTSACEFAVALRLTENNQIGAVTDMKVRMLGIVQEFFPDFFQDIDQSKLVRCIEIAQYRKKLLKFVEARLDDSEDAPDPRGLDRRRLNARDIETVRNAARALSPAKIARDIIKRQRIFRFEDGKEPTPVGEEFFIGMSQIRDMYLPNVELRGNPLLFNHLTIFLDRMMLGSLKHVESRKFPISMNLNIKSVFTPEFRQFTEDMDQAGMKDIQFEFRVTDIIRNFAQYKLIRQLFDNLGGKIAIDMISPDIAGTIRFSRIGPTAAKIIWPEDGVPDVDQLTADVSSMKQEGITPILARVDDSRGIEFGKRVGIDTFQGFHLDNMTATLAA